MIRDESENGMGKEPSVIHDTYNQRHRKERSRPLTSRHDQFSNSFKPNEKLMWVVRREDPK